MTLAIVRRFEPVHVEIGSYELSTVALRAIDLASDGSQAGAAAADARQLVGPGIFTILGGLRAILGCNLAIVAALCPIIRCHLAVVDGSHATVGGISPLRGRPDTRILRALTIGRRAISGGSVEIARRVVTRFGVTVA